MLKYGKEISIIAHCPHSNCEEIKKIGYRFVFKNMNGNSFIPVYLQQPNRAYKSVSEKCSSCGLSMYSSEEQARKSYIHLGKIIKNIHLKLGNKLATVEITPNLGLSGKENQHGHFDFFEFKNCKLEQHSSVVGDL